jgi:hypothetical protein
MALLSVPSYSGRCTDAVAVLILQASRRRHAVGAAARVQPAAAAAPLLHRPQLYLDRSGGRISGITSASSNTIWSAAGGCSGRRSRQAGASAPKTLRRLAAPQGTGAVLRM